MAHYDSTCKFCGNFGVFVEFDCGCKESIKFKKDEYSKDIKKFDESLEYLTINEFPYRYNWNKFNEKDRFKCIQIANWLKNILKEK